jgi:hypothetical protein
MHSILTKQLVDDHIRELRRAARPVRFAPVRRTRTRARKSR